MGFGWGILMNEEVEEIQLEVAIRREIYNDFVIRSSNCIKIGVLCRGYYADTVGGNEKKTGKYVRNQFVEK